MGADAFYVYYGVKRSLQPDSSETDLLEQEKHPILQALFKAKLHFAWGRMTEGEDYFLLIGHEIGRFGVENQTYLKIPVDEIRLIMEETNQRLKQAGIIDTPAFHCQLETQY
jgi:hypothetical protein